MSSSKNIERETLVYKGYEAQRTLLRALTTIEVENLPPALIPLYCQAATRPLLYTGLPLEVFQNKDPKLLATFQSWMRVGGQQEEVMQLIQDLIRELS